MSQSTEQVPFRTQVKVSLSNFLQKYRGVLIVGIGGVIVIVIALAVWTHVDAATKVDFAAKIEKSQSDFAAWQGEGDEAKKAELAKVLEDELVVIQKTAPTGYGLLKAWFIQGNYWALQKKWTEAAQAFKTVFEKDSSHYLAPISLINAAVSLEEAGDLDGALALYALFEKNYAADTLLAPQAFFSEGRILEAQNKGSEAVAAYKKLLEKHPDSTWTKLGRDRILLLED